MANNNLLNNNFKGSAVLLDTAGNPAVVGTVIGDTLLVSADDGQAFIINLNDLDVNLDHFAFNLMDKFHLSISDVHNADNISSPIVNEFTIGDQVINVIGSLFKVVDVAKFILALDDLTI